MESNRVISKLRIYQWIFSREIPLKIAQICRRSSDAELRPSSPSSCRRSIASWLGKKLHHGDIENSLIELVFCLKVTHTHTDIYIYIGQWWIIIEISGIRIVVCKFIWKWLSWACIAPKTHACTADTWANTLRDQYVGPIRAHVYMAHLRYLASNLIFGLVRSLTINHE